MRAVLAVLILSLTLGPAASAGGTAKRPPLLDDVWTLRQTGGIQVSPDGARIIYRVGSADIRTDSYESEVRIRNADGSDDQPFGDVGSYAWSPDGSMIAYTAQTDGGSQLFVRPAGGDEEAARVLTEGSLSPGQISWSPDGRQIAFMGRTEGGNDDFAPALPQPPEGAKWNPEPGIVRDLHYRNIAGSLRTSFRHLFVVPADGSAKARALTGGLWDAGARYGGVPWFSAYSWSADSVTIFFDGLMREEGPDDWALSDINAVEVATGTMRVVRQTQGFAIMPEAAPTGDLVAYVAYEKPLESWPKRQLRVMSADGSEDRVVLDDLPDDPSGLIWAEDGQGLYMSQNAEGRTNLRYVALTGEARWVTEGDHRFFVSQIAGGAAYGRLESVSDAPEIARAELATGAMTRLTDINAEYKAQAQTLSAESFWYDAPDGTRVQGFLIRPAGFDPAKTYPLALEVHGGPHLMAGYSFDWRFQDLAASGYVVAWLNPRGSTGYGYAFANAIDRQFPGDIDGGDLIAGVDALVAKGFVDAKRLHVFGCSGGGSLTAWLIGKTDRFASAGVLCPVTDWISMAGTTDAAAWAYHRFEKPFWEDPGPWLKHSPLMLAGSVKTPTLVMTGDKDFRTPMGQAEQLYSVLRARGVPTRLVIMRNETHQPWKSLPSSLVRSQIILKAWFELYGGTDAP